jgi:hypothetical protein
MNWTLKLQLSKLCQETHLKYTQVLPVALLRIRCSPNKQTRSSPYEILYEMPPPLIKGFRENLLKKRQSYPTTTNKRLRDSFSQAP